MEGRDINSLTRIDLLRIYYGRHPGWWRTVPQLADYLGMNVRQAREFLQANGIKIRNPKDNWEKIVWIMKQRYNPDYYTNLEAKVRGILAEKKLFPEKHFHHNFKLGTASIDFYFPDRRVALEVDSVWHYEMRWVKPADADAKRDKKLRALGCRVVRIRFEDDKEARRKVLAFLRRYGIKNGNRAHKRRLIK